ncbi:MAG TPA: alpha/beta hydrolase [Burkholderiaceae bacterium]|nr:alpha/beta hydrolase [Burkholderiaceae bacterium]
MLDPQAKAYLDLLATIGAPPLHSLQAPQARLAYKKARALAQPEPPQVARVEALAATGPAGPIPLRTYRPLDSRDGEALPVLVFMHGGGWTIGDLDTHDVPCREICNRARCAVISIDYRLAPEHRFPAAVEDTIAAVRWIAANAARLSIDARRIAVGGDSAGGNLAAVAALTLRDGGGPPLAVQLLIYPATDFRANTPSHAQNGSGYLLTREAIDYFTNSYLNGPGDIADWRASPALAQSFRGLPPAFVLTAGYDPLRDEGAQYAQLLREAGVAVEYVCFEAQIHGFITMSKVIDAAGVAFERCAGALRRAFGDGAR